MMASMIRTLCDEGVELVEALALLVRVLQLGHLQQRQAQRPHVTAHIHHTLREHLRLHGVSTCITWIYAYVNDYICTYQYKLFNDERKRTSHDVGIIRRKLVVMHATCMHLMALKRIKHGRKDSIMC